MNVWRALPSLFFVDEFQDTSLMQWQNLVPLIDNALSQNDPNGQPGSLMIWAMPNNPYTGGGWFARTIHEPL